MIATCHRGLAASQHVVRIQLAQESHPLPPTRPRRTRMLASCAKAGGSAASAPVSRASRTLRSATASWVSCCQSADATWDCKPARIESIVGGAVVAAERLEGATQRRRGCRVALRELQRQPVEEQVGRPRWPGAPCGERGAGHLDRIAALVRAEADRRSQRVQVRLAREIDVERLEPPRGVVEPRVPRLRRPRCTPLGRAAGRRGRARARSSGPASAVISVCRAPSGSPACRATSALASALRALSAASGAQRCGDAARTLLLRPRRRARRLPATTARVLQRRSRRAQTRRGHDAKRAVPDRTRTSVASASARWAMHRSSGDANR